MTTNVALLRGINVGGNAVIPMAELRELCRTLGWSDVRTCLQSGNVVFRTSADTSTLETQLEEGVRDRFGHRITVIVRDQATFERYLDEMPYVNEAAEDPSHVLLYTAKRPVNAEAAESLALRSQAGEKVKVAEGVLWICFPRGIGTSKLTPAVIDRALGSPATARNWNTLTKVLNLCREAANGS